MVVLFEVLVFCILAALALALRGEMRERTERRRWAAQRAFPTVISWREGTSPPPVVRSEPQFITG